MRAADGSVLRLRPAFLSLQQLAAAARLAGDLAALSWRRRRAAARWKVVAALDVMTVHTAGGGVGGCGGEGEGEGEGEG